MGNHKKRASYDAASGHHAKELRRKKVRDRASGLPAGTVLNARPEVPSVKTKHQTYYELVENTDKKKKLEFEITNKRTPPPGFEFVPIGNPELTTACKEISREKDAMIFIVSIGNRTEAGTLAHQTHRIGHHIRQAIVEEARQAVSDSGESSDEQPPPGVPEPIPETQQEINEQADKAMRDLFPRIPHTDRQTIIEHSFKKGATKKGEPLVGLAPSIPLSRRVQLAVLAHIRHTHTRYDELLQETSYTNARKAVEKLCLDVLVKWRGDEETGRDQLDEILREVIVISDTESEDDDVDSADSDTSGVESGDLADDASHPRQSHLVAHHQPYFEHPGLAREQGQCFLRYDKSLSTMGAPLARYSPAFVPVAATVARDRRRGFKRYEAALSMRWDEARNRVRLQNAHPSRQQPVHVASQPSYSQRGPLQQEERQTHAAFHHHNLQRDTSYQRGVHVGCPHSLQPTTRDTISMPPGHAPLRNPDALSRVDVQYASDQYRMIPPQRVLVRSDQTQDYLVPSIERATPVTEERPLSTGPIFVRPVSPRQTSRPPGEFIRDMPTQLQRPYSPSWGGPESSKRRRIIGYESRYESGSDQPPHLEQKHHIERRLLLHSNERQGPEFLPHTVHSYIDRRTHIPVSQTQPLINARIPAQEIYPCDSVQTNAYRGAEFAGRVDSDEQDKRLSSPGVSRPAYVYHETAAPVCREPHVVGLRRDVNYARPVQNHDLPVVYDHAPIYIQPRPSHDNVPVDLANNIESYSSRPVFHDRSESGATDSLQNVAYTFPRSPRPSNHMESTPVFVRQVIRSDMHHIEDDEERSEQRYSEVGTHGYPPPHYRLNGPPSLSYPQDSGLSHNGQTAYTEAHSPYYSDFR